LDECLRVIELAIQARFSRTVKKPLTSSAGGQSSLSRQFRNQDLMKWIRGSSGKIREAQSGVARKDLNEKELAGAYGRLGDIYQAYGLNERRSHAWHAHALQRRHSVPYYLRLSLADQRYLQQALSKLSAAPTPSPPMRQGMRSDSPHGKRKPEPETRSMKPETISERALARCHKCGGL